MSDMPEKPVKKPARKKAAPKPDVEAKSADASAGAQAKKMDANKLDDDQMREAVLAASLPHAAFDGFTDQLLQKAGLEAGIAKSDLARLFENGPLGLIEFYSSWADAEMEKRLAAMDLKAMKIRERIATAVKTRLMVLKPQRKPRGAPPPCCRCPCMPRWAPS